MRVLVTGGAGFIGSHLCERLLRDRHEVICLDNFFSGRRANVLHLRANSDFELIRHDTVEPILLEVDRIFHLACPASPVHYQYNPVKTLKTSVMGPINMLALEELQEEEEVAAKFLERGAGPQVGQGPGPEQGAGDGVVGAFLAQDIEEDKRHGEEAQDGPGRGEKIRPGHRCHL